MAASIVGGPLPPVVLFPNSSGMGGLEAHVVQVARGLCQRDVSVAAVCPKREDLQRLRDGLVEAGATVHSMSNRDGTPGGAARRLRALVGTFRRYPGCIIHMQYGGYGGGELVQIAAGLAHARAVVRTEQVPPVPPITRRGRIMVQLRDRFLARVICVSEQNRLAHLRDLGRDPKKCVVVHNGIDLQRFSPEIRGDSARSELGLDQSTPLIGTVSRLDETRKGINYFLDMAAAVSTVNSKVAFVIVGEGDQRRSLQAQAARLGLADRVIFTGDRQDVPRWLAAMYACVIPSLYEGCQHTLLEAMAMRKPVISTPAGVACEVVKDGETGLLVPFADGGAIARAVLALLADSALASRVAESGREAIAGRFSIDVMVDKIIRVYREALASRALR